MVGVGQGHLGLGCLGTLNEARDVASPDWGLGIRAQQWTRPGF